jgi:AbrB family looped-hinge helix DNA binding protein
MKHLVSTITSKGQVTIPAEIRRLLDVDYHDKIAFIVEGEQVRVTGIKGVVERTAGAFKSHEPPLTAEELREVAEQAFTEEALGRLGG